MSVTQTAASAAPVPGEITPGPKALSIDLSGTTIDDLCQLGYVCDDMSNPATCVLNQVDVDTDIMYEDTLHGIRVELKHSDFTQHRDQLPVTYAVAPEAQTAPPEVIQVSGQLRNHFISHPDSHTVFEEHAVSGVVNLFDFTGAKDAVGIIRSQQDVWVGYSFWVQFGGADWLAGSISSPCSRDPLCRSRSASPGDGGIPCPR